MTRRWDRLSPSAALEVPLVLIFVQLSIVTDRKAVDESITGSQDTYEVPTAVLGLVMAQDILAFRQCFRPRFLDRSLRTVIFDPSRDPVRHCGSGLLRYIRWLDRAFLFLIDQGQPPALPTSTRSHSSRQAQDHHAVLHFAPCFRPLCRQDRGGVTYARWCEAFLPIICVLIMRPLSVRGQPARASELHHGEWQGVADPPV
jgi:hypothetical protein